MAERLIMTFNFWMLPRQDPEKKDITVRKAEFVEIYKPLQRKWLQTRPSLFRLW